jgi:hypothetical protein
MTSARRGRLIAAIWLIGLGSVFLAKQLLDIPWSAAWPLFIVLVGVVAFLSTAMGGGLRGLSALWAFTWPVVTIVVGLLLLGSTTGFLAQGPFELVLQWWALGIFVLGLWFLVGAFIPHGQPVETLAVPLEGAADASVRIRFGAGELATIRAEPGNLVDGRFEGGVVLKRDGPSRIELSQDTRYGVPWLERQHDWTVGLSGEVPLDLRVDTGAARGELDLADLRVRSLELHTGASETRVRLPRAAGATSVRAQTGAASLVIEVPSGVAARIRSRVTIGTSDVDQARFPREGDGYASPDYATAANRADIDVTGGVGSVRIVGGA